MSRTLSRLLSGLWNTPLMVTEAKLEAVVAALPAILAQRAPGIRFDDGEMPEMPARPTRPTHGYSIRDGVATVPVHGVLVRRAGQINPQSEPLQSYEGLGGILNRAVSDQRVRGLLLDMDSPGGESGQALDLARQIRQLSQVKPIWSVANDEAMSAAYGIASAAHRLWVTPTSGVGSIGVVAMHTDRTAQDAREGVKYNFVHAGRRKVDFTEHAPLSVDARQRLQAEVDRLQAMFVDTVAAHRGLSPAAVSGTEAGLLFGPEAVAAGLADQVGSPADAHAALAAYVTPSRTRSSAMSSQQADPTPAPAPEAPPPPQVTPQPQPTQPAAPPAVPEPPQQQPSPAQPPQQPHPEQAASDLTNVVGMAVQSERARGIEIIAACQLAHRPGLAEQLVRSDMTAEQARRHLLALDAQEGAAVRVTPTATAGTQAAGPQLPQPINSAEAFSTHRQQPQRRT